MIVASTFNLAAKSTQELKGLYLRIFNEISNPRLSPNERRMANSLLIILRIELSMRPIP